jgi:hypothetical protein
MHPQSRKRRFIDVHPRRREMMFMDIFLKIAHGFEFKKFKDAVKRNPGDQLLRARFAKFCLNHYFNHQNASGLDEKEAVYQFENIDHLELRDLEIYYLMGKYYRGQDDGKAAAVYWQGIKKYNEFSNRDYAMKHECVEMAFSRDGFQHRLEPVEAGKEPRRPGT